MNADWLACAPQEVIETFLDTLSDHAIQSIPYLWDFWAMPHQLPPEPENWRSWVIMGGRGAGKTRAGAEWVRSEVEGSAPYDLGRAKRVALIGETIEQVREVMVFGESGLLAISPPDRRPIWEASRKRLVWPNGAIAQIFSAFEPESLRGPQFDLAWADELAKWRHAEEAWNMLQFALRLGNNPRAVVTTTPRNKAIFKEILEHESTVVTSAPTKANRANLAASFLSEVERRYEGTSLGRQELSGQLVTDLADALWPAHILDACQIQDIHKPLNRIVVAIDPPVTSGKNSDLCGIIVAGAYTQGAPKDWFGVVLEDASIKGTPNDWIDTALRVRDKYSAHKIIAEVNQGGELIETLLRQKDEFASYGGVRAINSKALRAEPISALYEQRRIFHMPGLDALERQMSEMVRSGFQGKGSPDRVDALVWALQDLIIKRAAHWSRPGVRTL